MAMLYAKRILAGKMTIEEVPELWRAEVEVIIHPISE